MRLIDTDNLKYSCISDECGLTGCNYCLYNVITEYEIDKTPTVPAIPISVIEQIKKEILNKENYSIGSEMYMNGELIDADISVGIVLEIIDKHIKEYTE